MENQTKTTNLHSRVLKRKSFLRHSAVKVRKRNCVGDIASAKTRHLIRSIEMITLLNFENYDLDYVVEYPVSIEQFGNDGKNTLEF